jgi:hypothetical protein
MGRLRHQDRPGVGTALHPRRQVGGVADRRVVHAEVIADSPDNHGPAVQPDPELDLDPVLSLELLA